jgi:amino acid adenylation domain-containing protein
MEAVIEQLKLLWAAELEYDEEIDICDNFFELGGDSIAVNRVVSAAHDCGIVLSAIDIFTHPTIEALAVVAKKVEWQETTVVDAFSLVPTMSSVETKTRVAAAGGLMEDSIQDIYPCTPLQEGLMALSTQGNQGYIRQQVFSLPEVTDIQSLHDAWNATVQCTPILRTIIVFDRDLGSLQVVLDKTPIWKTAEDLEEYLEQDRQLPMFYGQALTRYAIIETSEQNQPRYFVWTAHHAVYDGWCLPLILERVTCAYEGRDLPDSTPFNSYISHLQDLELDEKSRKYWASYLQDASPTSFPPAPIPGRSRTWKRSELQVTLSRPCQASFRISTVIRAAWGILLARYSDSDDVMFGETVSGRNASVKGILSIVGPTVSTVPVRIRLGTKSIHEYLQMVQEQTIETIPYEHYGLQNIQKTNRACGFQSLLVLQPAAKLTHHGDLFIDRTVKVINEFNSYTLTMECSINDGQIQFMASYDESLLCRTQIDLLLHHFEHIMQQLAQESTTLAVDAIDLFTTHDKALVNNWNIGVPVRKVEKLIHDVFEEQVELRPDSLALSAWDGNFTYKELSRLSTKLAGHLQGLQGDSFHENLIPICFEKSRWTTIAMLGILKSGSAFVPLDPSHPQQRLKEIVEHTRAPFILGSKVTQPRWHGETVPFVELSVLMSQPQVDDSGSKIQHVDPSDPAYVIFTSGSTGKPKGVVIQHDAYLSGALARAAVIKRDHMSRVLQFSSYSFDTSIEDTLTTLVVGGTICVPAEEQRMGNISAFIQDHAVNTIDVTPSFLALLDPAVLTSLRTVIVGGERITDHVIKTWMPHVDLINTYGPTETSIVATATQIIRSLNNSPSIGRGIGALTWVVDPRDPHRLAPVGVPGELLIEGPILGRGYLHDTEKTQASFVEDLEWTQADSTSSNVARRFYRTGDLVKYDLNGELLFIGRKDTQVKLHGQRIELGEIEHAIMTNSPDSISDVVVEMMSLPASGRDQTLVACFQMAFQRSWDEAVSPQNMRLDMSQPIRANLAQLEGRLYDSLPSYMIPTMYVPFQRLPTTISGKIDRLKIRQHVLGIPLTVVASYTLSIDAAKRQPETALEIKMQKLWAEVLQIDQNCIGRDDSFFRVGGDSITAIRLVATAEEHKIPIRITDMLRKMSLAKVCEQLQDRVLEAAAYAGSRVLDIPAFALIGEGKQSQDLFEDIKLQWGIRRDDIEDAYPCTPLQEGMLTLSTRQAGAYTSQMVFTLPESIDVKRFQEAWIAASKSIETLRTTIVSSSNRSLQLVSRRTNISWRYSDSLLNYLKDDQNEQIGYGKALARYAIVSEQKSYGRRQYLVWTAHHAMYDGWSLPLILEKVSCAYQCIPSPAATTPFNRYIQYLVNSNVDKNRDYWRKYLDGAALSSFPPTPSFEHTERLGKTTIIKIPLPRLAVSTFTTPTVIRAAWSVIIGTYSAVKDVVFGSTMSGRNAPVKGITTIIGPTITTIPVRIRLDFTRTITQFLQEVEDQAVDLVPFEHFGIQNIKRVSKDAQAACSFQNLLVIQPDTGALPDTVQNVFKDLSIETTSSFNTYTLVVDCALEGDNVNVVTSFDEALISQKQIDLLLCHFKRVLQQLSDETPDLTIGSLDLFGIEDQALISSWNSQVPRKVERCIHHVIEDQAKDTPHAPAISSWDGEMTYEALEWHSTVLGRHLQKLGVTPETFVPFCFEKSMWGIVAMLGALKSGGAFVALDPTHPQRRLDSILDQTKATIILGSPETEKMWNTREELHFLNVPRLMQQLQDEEQLPMHQISLNSRVGPDNLAYAVFTSGSTGTPKGVLIEHGSYCSGALARASAIKRDSNSRLLQFSSYSFDTSIEDILTTLMVGGCICSPSETGRKEDLASYIREAKVSRSRNTKLKPRIVLTCTLHSRLIVQS